MDDYMALVKKTYGSGVVWEKSLTLEDAKNAMKKSR